MKLTLIRGLPGAGKTTEAKKLTNKDPNLAHFEADMYFLDINGNYTYDLYLQQAAHKWCQYQTEGALRNGHSVVVSNTFSQYWEMIPYFILAREYGARVEVVTCTGEYKSLHNVPEDAIARMELRWED